MLEVGIAIASGQLGGVRMIRLGAWVSWPQAGAYRERSMDQYEIVADVAVVLRP